MSAETFGSKSLKVPRVLEMWNSAYDCHTMIVPVSGLLIDSGATAPVLPFRCMITLGHVMNLIDGL